MTFLNLHIGTPKTATSTIQEALWINHQSLPNYNLIYLNELGETNNIDLFLACLHHEEWGFGILENRELFGKEARDSFRREVISRLQSISKRASDSSPSIELLASSEHLWFLWSDLHFTNLRNILRESGVELKSIIAYLRPQSDLLYSSLSTMVRDGFVADDVDPSWVNNHEYRYLDYHRCLSSWRVSFPNAVFNIRLFKEYATDILADFFKVCDLPLDKLTRPRDMNTSLSNVGISMLSRLNGLFLSNLSNDQVYEYLRCDNQRVRLGNMVEKHFIGRPIPTKAVCDHINNFYAQGNSLLLEEYLPDRSLNDLLSNSAKFLTIDEARLVFDSSKRFVDMLLELSS